MQLGRILPKLPRDKIIVQTKVSPKRTAREFLDTFDTSMKYLGLDYVDLLALHGINNRELLRYSLAPGGCLAAARKLQQQGRARFIGFSTHAVHNPNAAPSKNSGIIAATSRRWIRPVFHHSTSNSAAGNEQVTVLLSNAARNNPSISA